MTQEENLEDVVRQLTELGFPGTGLYEYLDSCAGMQDIPYGHRKRIGDDLMSYQLTIKKDQLSGLYQPEGYRATLLQTHPVPHDYIGGMDTLMLEQRLKEVNWQEYIPKSVQLDGTMFQNILDVVNLGLWQTKEATDISRRLQLRYWLHTPVEQDLNVSLHINDYEKSHYFPLNNDLSDIHTKEAYNLLSGRAVMKFQQNENEPGRFYSHWKVISNDRLETLPDYDFMAILKALPIPEARQDSTGPRLIHDLIRGDRVPVTLLEGERAIPAYIEAHPHDQSIIMYDRNMVRLYPGQLHPQKEQQPIVEKQAPPKKRTGKNKGRSI